MALLVRHVLLQLGTSARPQTTLTFITTGSIGALITDIALNMAGMATTGATTGAPATGLFTTCAVLGRLVINLDLVPNLGY